MNWDYNVKQDLLYTKECIFMFAYQINKTLETWGEAIEQNCLTMNSLVTLGANKNNYTSVLTGLKYINML